MNTSSLLQAGKATLLFLSALTLGGALGGTLSMAETSLQSGEAFHVIPALGIGATYVLFGAVPALLLGVPAAIILHRLNCGRGAAALILMFGGAATGAALMQITFTGFERWAAIAGGSIGLLMGAFLIPKQKKQETHA